MSETRGRSIGLTFALLGFLAVVAGIWVGQRVHPFPWFLAAVFLVLSALTRRFGVALPGKWFVSFVPAAAASAAIALGWGPAGVIGVAGFVAGDLVFRRIPLVSTLESAGHLAAGIAVGGGIFQLLGGRPGLAAFRGDNILLVVLLFLLVSLTANVIVFAQMKAAGTIGRVNPRLTLRWETVAAFFGLALGASGLRLLLGGLPPQLELGLTTVWLLFAALSYFVLRRGASAEGYLAVEALTRAIGARTSFADAFHDVRGLTGTLVPWQHMGLSRYEDGSGEFVVVAETSPDVTPGFRFRATRALTAVALERRMPVTDWDLPPERRLERRERGAEILVPLYVGGRLVGMWSVRHPVAGTYWRSDADLLGRLATPLALAITLESLVEPVVASSSRTAREVAQIAGATQRLQAGAERAIGDSRRTAATVRQVAETLISGAESAGVAQQAAEANATNGAATLATGQELLATAREVRATTVGAAERLRQASRVVQEGAEQIARLRETSDLVDQFRRAIEDVAYESGMLALNAAIEASRAGEAGRGFGVVAREIRALAERSVREAQGAARNVQEIQERLDRAAGILERIQSEVGQAADLGGAMVERIDVIHQAAEQVAAIGERIAESGRHSAQRSADLAAALAGGRQLAERAAQESEGVAAVNAEQGVLVRQLAEVARSLQALAEDLGRSIQRVRQSGGT